MTVRARLYPGQVEGGVCEESGGVGRQPHCAVRAGVVGGAKMEQSLHRVYGAAEEVCRLALPKEPWCAVSWVEALRV